MGKSNYTKEQREKIAKEAIDVGKVKAVAERYNVDPTLVYGWVKTLRDKNIQQKNKSARDYEQELRKKDLEIKILQELLKKTTNVLIKD